MLVVAAFALKKFKFEIWGRSVDHIATDNLFLKCQQCLLVYMKLNHLLPEIRASCGLPFPLKKKVLSVLRR